MRGPPASRKSSAAGALFGMCYESADQAWYTYPPDAAEVCPGDPEFLDFVLSFDAMDPVLRRAHEVRSLAPAIG